MLHGKGKDQRFLTESYSEDRNKAITDHTGYTDAELAELEVTLADGGRKTDPETYRIYQFPFPVDQTVRSRKKIDIRKVDPRIGEMSD